MRSERFEYFAGDSGSELTFSQALTESTPESQRLPYLFQTHLLETMICGTECSLERAQVSGSLKPVLSAFCCCDEIPAESSFVLVAVSEVSSLLHHLWPVVKWSTVGRRHD